LAVFSGVARPGAVDAVRSEGFQVQLGVQPPAVHGPAVAGGVVAALGPAGRLDQPAQPRHHRPIHQRERVLDRFQPRVWGRRQHLSGQLLDDRLEPLGLEGPHRLRKAAQGKTTDAQSPRHRRQLRRLLKPPDGIDQRVPDVQQHQLTISIEEQFAVAGAVAFAANVSQSVQQVKNPAHVSQAMDVLILQWLAFFHGGWIGCHREAGSAISKCC